MMMFHIKINVPLNTGNKRNNLYKKKKLNNIQY